MKRVTELVRRRRRRFIRWAHAVYPPGFRGQSLWAVWIRFYEIIGSSEFNLSASAMAFNFFLSLLPAVIFIFSLIPHLPIQNLEAEARAWLSGVLPAQAVEMLTSTMEDLFDNKRTGLLSFSILIVVFTSMRGLLTMLHAFQAIGPKPARTYSFFKSYAVAFFALVVLLLFTIIGLSLFIGGQLALDWLFYHLHWLQAWSYYAAIGFYWLMNFLIYLAGVTFLFRLSPCIRTHWSFLSPGGLLSALLLIGAQAALRFYFANFGNYNALYGSLSAIVILMLWFYYLSMVVLAGYTLNAGVEEAETATLAAMAEELLAEQQAADARGDSQPDPGFPAIT